MKDYPVIIFNAVSSCDLPKSTLVVNKSMLEYITWIYTPVEIHKMYKLFQISQTCPNTQEIEPSNVLDWPCSRPWLKLKTSSLDLSPGHHIYRLWFVDSYSHDTVSLYFSYILQDDNTDKPYIYMDRDNSENSSTSATYITYEGVV